jgi:hypothetical protein
VLFAEVYWADLSDAGEGLRRVFLQLFKLVFNLRHVADQAADFPELTALRALRLLLFFAAMILCGPIAAVTLYVLALLVARLLALGVLNWFGVTASELARHAGAGAVGIAGTILGAYLWGRYRRQKLRGTKSLLSASVVFVGAGVAALAMYRLGWLPKELWPSKVIQWAENLRSGPTPYPGPFWDYLVALMLAANVFFLVLGCVIALAMVAWIVAHCEAIARSARGARPAINVAFGATLLQIGLWVLLVPAFGSLVFSQLPRDVVAGKQALFARVLVEFVENMALGMVVVMCVVWVELCRRHWVTEHPGPYSTPEALGAARTIPRLLVNSRPLYALIAVTVYSHQVFAYYAFSRAAERFPGQQALQPIVPFVVVVLVIGMALVALFLQSGLRAALHVVMDVVNHFYRRALPVPWPWRPPGPVAPGRFAIQQQIEARFRRVLQEVLADGDVTHVTVVAHSQGTIIAVDVLCMRWTNKLLGGRQVRLVTMGSPFTHLYQYYFPHRYPPLFVADGGRERFNPEWWSLGENLGGWLNIFRVDDFVGTHIDGAADRSFPVNRCLAAGGWAKGAGHTGYWQEAAALAEMAECLP